MEIILNSFEFFLYSSFGYQFNSRVHFNKWKMGNQCFYFRLCMALGDIRNNYRLRYVIHFFKHEANIYNS